MPKFWSFIGNEKYDVGCTGQTVYVYLKDGTEVARFKDITYAYTPLISPDGRILVVKSTAGKLAAYSLETLSLIRKFRFSKLDGAQDDGFCFSADGKYLYNIERDESSLKNELSVYDTRDFSPVKKVLWDEGVVIDHIECDADSGVFFVLGFCRDKDCGVASEFFVAKLNEDVLTDMRYIPVAEYRHYWWYLRLQMNGFTEMASKYSLGDVSINERKSEKLSLAKLWRDQGTADFLQNTCEDREAVCRREKE